MGLKDKNNVRMLFIIISTILLIMVLGFTGILNLMSFQENYCDSLLSSYSVLGGETVDKIEYAIRYGKPLNNFLGMETLLAEIIVNYPSIDMAQVVLNDGQVIYDQSGRVNDRYLPDNLWENVNFNGGEGENTYQALVQEDKYYLFLPIVDKDKEWIGSLNIQFAESVINSVVANYLGDLVKYLTFLVIIGFIVLVVVTMRTSFVDHGGRMKKKSFIIVILVILGLLQIIYGFLNYHIFKKAYLEVAHTNTATISKIIQRNVDSVLEKGVPYNELYNVQDYLQQTISSIPEIANIYLYGAEKNLLYSTLEKGSLPAINLGSDYVYSQELTSDINGKGGSVWVEISSKSIANKLRTILLDTVTVLIISFLLMVEVTLFVIMLIGKKVNKNIEESTTDSWERITIPMVRYLAFLVFAAAFMSSAFIPILMNKLYEPILGLPKNVVLGLPISVEMLFGALAAIVAGYSIDKKGCKSVLLGGIILFSLGALFSAVAGDALSFITARGVVGVGFGLALMALRAIVISPPDSLLKNQGIAAMNSGAFAGVNCGVIIGAMLADRIGYSQVFFVAFVILLVSGFVAKAFIANVIPKRGKKQVGVNRVKTSQFIFNKNVLAFFVLVLIPVSICGMFLQYVFPIFAESMGISSSNIGRAFLLNGLVIIYLGPILSKYSEKHLGPKKSLVIAALIMGIALLIFAIWGTLTAAFVVVILLGLADSFGVAAQSNYFLSLRAVSDLGEGKAIAYFSIVGKLGQMLGPIAFGMVAVLGLVKGTGVLGVVGIIAFLLFAKSISASNLVEDGSA